MMLPYADLHVHSSQSDGKLSLPALIAHARDNGIGVLAPTDHNNYAGLTQLRKENPDMVLIDGMEASCSYEDLTGKLQQPHIIALGFDPDHPEMIRLRSLCNPDRRPYNEAQLLALKRNGMDLGSYEDLLARWPGRPQIGTRQFAEDLVKFGFASSVQDAYDRILGYEGCARVKNPLRYPSVEETVKAILAANGLPVIAHLFYYGWDDRDLHHFVGMVRELCGGGLGCAGIETAYAEYDLFLQARLCREFARPYGLLRSCASDFHGVGLNPSDHLSHHFLREDFRPILERLGVKN